MQIKHTMTEACSGLPHVGETAVLDIFQDDNDTITVSVVGGGPAAYLAVRITAGELVTACAGVSRTYAITRAKWVSLVLDEAWEQRGGGDGDIVLTNEEGRD